MNNSAGDLSCTGNADDSAYSLMKSNADAIMSSSSGYDFPGSWIRRRSNAHDLNYIGNAGDLGYSGLNYNADGLMCRCNAYDLAGT